MKTLALAFALCLSSVPLTAIPIVIGSGNPGNLGTDNVLFNDSSLIHEGSVVQGNFSGQGLGYVIEFTSDSGTGKLRGSGGQAKIEGLAGNDPFSELSFGLSGGATFTKAIFNIDSNDDGNLSIAVYFLGASGSPYEELVNLTEGGQNFFNITAGEGNQITAITLRTDDADINVARQFRIGGFANAVGVPDGGSTALMLGFAFFGCTQLSRICNKRR